MKRTFFLYIFSSITLIAVAQSYTPTTTWPFLNEDFLPGTVFFSDNGRTSEMQLNIHLSGATLWHTAGENLLLSDTAGIARVKIGESTFIYMNGELVRLIATESGAALVLSVKGDYRSIVAPSTGAYGMSTESISARNQTSVANIGNTHTLIHSAARSAREDGLPLPLIRKYFFIIGEKIIPATRKDVEKSVTRESLPALKSFIKEKKVRWSDESSLAQLLSILR
jgi:hypothetical protein